MREEERREKNSSYAMREKKSSYEQYINSEYVKEPVREAINDRGLFTAGWFGVREKHCSG